MLYEFNLSVSLMGRQAAVGPVLEGGAALTGKSVWTLCWLRREVTGLCLPGVPTSRTALVMNRFLSSMGKDRYGK